MAKLIDLTGKRFGSLTVVGIGELHRHPCGTSQRRWQVLCDCGNQFSALGEVLRHGKVKSCGCRRGAFKDAAGERFGKLTVLRLADAPKREGCSNYFWFCQCDCGETTEVNGAFLRNGMIRSCGCLRDAALELRTKHGATTGHRKRPEYNTWSAAKSRCFNPKEKAYPDYGGRGITMCAEWAKSFATFFKDMGSRPEGSSLDRIDPNKGYEPGNCRWVSSVVQSLNKRRNKMIRYNGITMTLKEWILELEKHVVAEDDRD